MGVSKFVKIGQALAITGQPRVRGDTRMEVEDDFVPLHVALAWVYARNTHFNDAIEKFGMWPLKAALADFNQTRGFGLNPVVGSDQQAWELLLKAIISEKLKLRGFLYVRWDGPGPEWKQVVSGIQNVYLGDGLELDITAEKPALVGTGFHPRRWERIAVEKRALTLFPTESTEVVAESRVNELIAAASRGCWSKSEWQLLSYKKIHKRLCEWIREHHEEYRDQVEMPISGISVYRFFKPLKARKK